MKGTKESNPFVPLFTIHCSFFTSEALRWRKR